jgi:hypothetical protein
MAPARKHVEQAAEFGSFLLATLVLSVIINFATDLRDNTFLWASAVTVALAAAGLVRVTHAKSFLPRNRPLTIAVGTVVVLALTGSAAREMTRPPPARCAPRAAAEAEMGDPDPRVAAPPPVVYYCPTHGNVHVYERPDSPLAVGKLHPARELWVACHKRGRGGRVWYYTQGDDVRARPELHAWGYLRQWGLELPVHPDPAVPPCGPRVP